MRGEGLEMRDERLKVNEERQREIGALLATTAGLSAQRSKL